MEERKFERRIQAPDGIHGDGIEVNGVEKPANICALALVAIAVTLFAVGTAILLKGVLQ